MNCHSQARFKASSLGPACSAGYYEGQVTAVHSDGTVDIVYEDGDAESRVKPEYVRPLATI